MQALQKVAPPDWRSAQRRQMLSLLLTIYKLKLPPLQLLHQSGERDL